MNANFNIFVNVLIVEDDDFLDVMLFWCLFGWKKKEFKAKSMKFP